MIKRFDGSTTLTPKQPKRCQNYKLDRVTDVFQQQKWLSESENPVLSPSVFQWSVSNTPHTYLFNLNCIPAHNIFIVSTSEQCIQATSKKLPLTARNTRKTKPIPYNFKGNTLRFPYAASPFGVSSVGMLAPVVAKGINSPFKSCTMSISGLTLPETNRNLKNDLKKLIYDTSMKQMKRIEKNKKSA